MKQLIFALLFAIGSIGLYGNEANCVAPQEVQVGDIFKIGDPDAPRYRHINFPRPNFIVKKGGVPNYNRLEGNKVVVTAVKEKKDGTIEVRIKRTDGLRFFGSHREVSADLKAALDSGELVGV